MSRGTHEPRAPIYKFQCEDGRRYIVYNASVINNPADHAPNKWYVRPYPVPVPLGAEGSEPFDSAEEAEAAARFRFSPDTAVGKAASGGASFA